jgi:hypothetical protein
MRLRLSDATTSAVLAEHYSAQAELCKQMARLTAGHGFPNETPAEAVW